MEKETPTAEYGPGDWAKAAVFGFVFFILLMAFGDTLEVVMPIAGFLLAVGWLAVLCLARLLAAIADLFGCGR